jgi:hypothetical protein
MEGDVGQLQVAQLLRRFQQLQAERAQAYARMHAGFKAMLAAQQQAPYHSLLGELTPEFNRINQQVGVDPAGSRVLVPAARQPAGQPAGRHGSPGSGAPCPAAAPVPPW